MICIKLNNNNCNVLCSVYSPCSEIASYNLQVKFLVYFHTLPVKRKSEKVRGHPQIRGGIRTIAAETIALQKMAPGLSAPSINAPKTIVNFGGYKFWWTFSAEKIFGTNSNFRQLLQQKFSSVSYFYIHSKRV